MHCTAIKPRSSEESIMFRNQWKQEIFTLPNLLSLFRLVLIPVYMTVYLHAGEPRDYWLAGGILAVSCLSDALDGMIARQLNMVSTVGKVLDPLADKITQFVLTLSLSLRYPPLQPVLLLFAVKELFQLTAGILYLRRGRMLPGALPEGKVSTAVLFTSLIVLVLFPLMPVPAVRAIAAADGFVLSIAFAGYINAYLGKTGKIRDMEA